MDNTSDWDSLSDTPPAVAPVVQDRSTPVDAQVADFADEANRRVAAGEDPATVEADLQSQVQSAQPKIPKGKTAKASEWDSLLDAPPELPGPPEEVGPPAALAGSPAPDTTATGDVPPDFGTGGGPLDTSGFAPAMAAQGRAIASGIPRALAGGEASLVKFAANIAPAVVAGTGNIAGGLALEQTLSPYAEEAGQVEQQVAQERAEDRASGASTPISRAIESGVGAAYALPQYAVVPEFEGADLAVAAVKALPASYSAAKTTFADLLPKVGVAKALEASGLTGIVNLVGASLPLGAAGTAAERVAAGAGVGVASEEAGRAGQNVILSDHPELQQPLDPEAIVQAGLTGGALGGFAGHPRLSDADIAAARVQQLTRGLTNAREIPQDQGGVPSQGTVEEGGREGGGADIQQNASAGDAASDAEGLTDVDQNVQPVGTERATEEAQAGEEGKGQAAPEVLADQGTADATASVAPDAQVPGDADTARAADAVAAGEEGLPAPMYARAETAGVDDAREAQDAAKAWQEQGTQSPYFQRYFEGSKVVDADGRPLVVHHGTGEDFAAFEGAKAGDTTGHMTAPLGHFFAVDRGSAERYAEKAAQGVPADERVIDAYLSIKNPKTMTLNEFMGIDSQDEARALKAQLQQQGYDGIHLTDAGKGQWIAFDPSQIKDVGNRGTFDATDARMKFAQREGAPQTDNLTQAQAREALTKEFGTTAMRKLEANGLTLTPRADLAQHAPELTPQQRAGVKGFTPPDKSSANVIHDNVTRAELPETVIHEVVHANLDRILPEATRNALASAIQARASKSPEVKASLDAIPKTTPKANYREEVLAQTMGDLYTQTIGRKVLDAFKLGLNRMGVPLDWINAHEAAIRQIGIENLRHYAEAPRRNPVTTVQMAPRAAPAGAGQAPAEKPRIRVPVDHVPVQRVAERPESAIANPESAIAEPMVRSVLKAPPVSKSETPFASPDAVGTKNAAQAAKRAERDLEPVVAEMRPSDKQVWESAAQRRTNDPTAGYRLAQEMAKNPERQISRENEAVLIQHSAELHNRYDDVLRRIETAQKAGNTADVVNAQMERMAIEQDLATNEKATKEIGRDWSDIGRMRQKLAERDFSMARQVLRFKAITGVDDLPQALRDQIAQHVKTIQAREAELSAALAENAKLREQQTAPVARRRIAPAERRTLDDEFNALAQRAAQLRKTAAGGTRYARVEDPELAQVIRRMARNRSDAGETDPQKVLAAIHEATGVPRRDIADTITSKEPYRKITRTELQQRYSDLKAALRDPSVQRDAALVKRLQAQLAETRSRIQRKDFSPPGKREAPPVSDNVQRLRNEVALEKQKLKALAEKHERLNMPALKKLLDIRKNLQLAMILGSKTVYEHLGFAVAGGHIGSLIADATRSLALNVVPGLKEFAEGAPRYGRGVSAKAYGARARGLAEAPRQMVNQVTRGAADRELPTSIGSGSDEFTTHLGTLADALKTPGALNKTMEVTRTVAGKIIGTHAATKELLTQPEFRETVQRETEHLVRSMIKNGATSEQVAQFMAKESTQSTLSAKGTAQAFTEKMQSSKNSFNKAVDAFVGSLERSPNAGANVLAGAFNAIEPIRKIGINMADRQVSNMAGVPRAAIAAWRNRGKMTPELRDYIMFNIGRQGVGVSMLAAGALMASQFGGVPGVFTKKEQPVQKDKDGNPLKPGAANMLPETAFHGSEFGLMQIGASMMQVYQKEYGKERGAELALDVLGRPTWNWFERTIPYTNTGRITYNTLQYGRNHGKYGNPWWEVLGDITRSHVVPSAVQQYARETDPYQGFRNARNIPEDVKLGVPGLREQVPQSR